MPPRRGLAARAAGKRHACSELARSQPGAGPRLLPHRHPPPTPSELRGRQKKPINRVNLRFKTLLGGVGGGGAHPRVPRAEAGGGTAGASLPSREQKRPLASRPVPCGCGRARGGPSSLCVCGGVTPLGVRDPSVPPQPRAVPGSSIPSRPRKFCSGFAPNRGGRGGPVTGGVRETKFRGSVPAAVVAVEGGTAPLPFPSLPAPLLNGFHHSSFLAK